VLPEFPYHPDPVATGAVVQSSAVCEVCGEARGFVYTGPIFAVDELESICPWCIADGRAQATFDASFTDIAEATEDVPRAVLEEVSSRTPGFSGLQQEEWLFHCGDGAAYVGSEGDDPMTHRFRCRHCGQDLSYEDWS